MPTNQGVIRIVTGTLAVLGALCVLSICVLAYFQIQIPPELNTLTGTLVGSLGSMLVKTAPTELPKAEPIRTEPQS